MVFEFDLLVILKLDWLVCIRKSKCGQHDGVVLQVISELYIQKERIFDCVCGDFTAGTFTDVNDLFGNIDEGMTFVITNYTKKRRAESKHEVGVRMVHEHY